MFNLVIMEKAMKGDLMKEISEILKQKRLEKGYTIDKISEMTRISVPHIKAIEAGNIDYFKNDLPYLRFYLKSYCNVLGLNYDDYRDLLQDSIEDYTQTFALNTLKEHEKSEKNIITQSKELKNLHPVQKKKIDFSLVSFLTIIAVVLLFVVMVAGYFLIREWKDDGEASNNVVPPVVQVPQQPEETNKDDDQKQDEEDSVVVDKQLSIAKKDAETYVISNAQELESVTISVEFVPRAWFQATLDDVVLSDPEAKIYESGTKLDIEMNPAEDKVLSMRIGYFAGMKFKVNGIDVELDEGLAKDAGARTIVFEIGGE